MTDIPKPTVGDTSWDDWASDVETATDKIHALGSWRIQQDGSSNLEFRIDGASDWAGRLSQSSSDFQVRGALIGAGLINYGKAGLRIPFNSAVTMDGSTLTATGASADKVGMQNSVTFQGGFSNEVANGASNPSWLFGANDFVKAGRSGTASDLAGVTTLYGRLTEAHIDSTDASLNTLYGLMVETSSNSPVTTVVGLRVVGHRHGDTGSAGTVTTATSLEVTSPTQGTDKFAVSTTGTARSSFTGSLDVGFGNGSQILHVYDGEFRGLRATVGGSAVATRGGVNYANDAMLTVRSRADGDVVTWLHGRGGQTGDLLRMGRDTTIGTRFDMRGRFIQVNSVAPGDADLANGELSMYVDPTAGAMKLMIKGKDSGGTVRTATVALA